MTLYFTLKSQQAINRRLSPMFPSFLAAISLVAAMAPASLATGAECRVTAAGGTIQGMPTWKSTASRMVPLTITVERDLYGRLVPSPVLAVSPDLNIRRITQGDSTNQGIASIGGCLSQDIRESARVHQVLITPIGKTQANAHKPVMKVSVLPYNGKRQVLTVRTTPPEIETSARYKADTIIGPVQDIQKPMLSDERSLSQAALPAVGESFPRFGAQPFVTPNPFQSAVQLPDNESLRMNLTTTLAFHAGNCASGCP